MAVYVLDLLYDTAVFAFRWFNLLEGLFWLVVAGAFAVGACRRGSRLALPAAALFVAFGISDWVEITTGAWWRPWWLLIWKGGCIAGLLLTYRLYLRRGGTATLAKVRLNPFRRDH